METDFLAWLAERLSPHPCLKLGPGDDAAVLDLGQRPQCVVTVDLLTDGVDFRLGETSSARIGRKALAVNFSDMAAMAARPLAAVVALALPRAGALELAMDLYQGILPLAAQFQTAIAGGDTNTWDGPLAISVTLIGQVTDRGVLRRDGARPGDAIVVSGDFGGSILGKHCDFHPRVDEALLLNERFDLRAGMDVSDGLSLDLSRLCQASRCGAVLDVAAIPVSPAAHELARTSGAAALDHALSDGEDFELLLALPMPDAQRLIAEQPLDVALTIIGEFVPEPGLWRRLPNGERGALPPRGYLH